MTLTHFEILMFFNQYKRLQK